VALDDEEEQSSDLDPDEDVDVSGLFGDDENIPPVDQSSSQNFSIASSGHDYTP
jgi:hypothetical protein